MCEEMEKDESLCGDCGREMILREREFVELGREMMVRDRVCVCV